MPEESAHNTPSDAPAPPPTPAGPVIEVALVGCAHIHTPGFIKTLNGRGDFRVKYVWDHDAARARRGAEELGGEGKGVRAVEDADVVWKDKAVKAAIVCSETNRHAALVSAAAKAKKHLFVEKPLGMGAKDAYAMAAAVEKAGVLFQTGYFMRGQPIPLFLREHVHRGSFGTITRVRASNCHGGALKGLFDAEWRWMADPAAAGCGAFGDLGTHSLDLLLWIMGQVSACTASVAKGTARYEGCDETGEGLLRFENGAIGTLAAGWVDVANPLTLLVSGTEGHAAVVNGKLYFQSNKVEGADGKEPWAQLPAPQPSGFELFLNTLHSGDQHAPLVSPREAAYRSAVMEALYEGAQKEKWLKPKPFPTPRARAAAAAVAGAVEPQELMPPPAAPEMGG